ncbi:MAG: hypothetical protein C4K47_05995 [Candidatus Thorarchaeota archaeon]|nr:MAG: hypothetical protein C4K47_05995 [Candidatus Thorarchaeota archaeon]
MKLNYRELFMEKMGILLRPDDIEATARDFLSSYASYMKEVGIVAKDPSGKTLYSSRTAPVDDKYTQFFEQWVSLTRALGIDSAVAMDFYTDGWFGRDPKYQTIGFKGQTLTHQICPNREEFWQYGAEIIKELGAYPIDEILLFGAGYVRDEFCFCERCRKEFAPMVDQEPKRLTYLYISENPDHLAKWYKWRTDKVNRGLQVLQDAAREVDKKAGRSKPLTIAVEVLIDPETGLSDGAMKRCGYDYTKIGEITGNILINLFPWSPLLPKKGTKQYNDLIESLYFTTEFKRRGGRASLFRWGVKTLDQFRELKAFGKDAGIDRFVVSLHYPNDYSTRRESAITSY